MVAGGLAAELLKTNKKIVGKEGWIITPREKTHPLTSQLGQIGNKITRVEKIDPTRENRFNGQKAG